MKTRTDIHRVSELIPDDYAYCFSFSAPTRVGFWPIPPFNVNRLHELRDRGEKFAGPHGWFKCDVCGASFKHGDCWKHVPTGEYITIGHICAEKYELFADYQEYNRQKAIHIAKAIREQKKLQIEESVKKILESTPGLKEAFELDNSFIRDVKSKLEEFGYLSERQIEAVLRTAKRIKEDKRDLIDIPTNGGRMTIEGTIASIKLVPGFAYNTTTTKMLVKVETPKGVYKVYGTMPISLVCESTHGDITGKRVRFEAKVIQKEKGFGFYSRPSKAEVLS